MAPAARRALGGWYARHGRHKLPWRLTRDPYAVLVSEVMLQQTQVDRVLPYYERWLARWPSVESLAEASPAEVIREWAGLGYNRRALHLLNTARAVREHHGGRLPGELDALVLLPGVGPYTAAAVASFAFDQRVALVDTNIARVLARSMLGLATAREAGAAAVRCAAEASLPGRGTRDHNLALMDLGALVCSARSPGCGDCPLVRRCAWRLAGKPDTERRVARTSPRFETTARFARGRILAALREHESLDQGAIEMALPAEHRPAAPAYLAALARDGLVAESCGWWSLPAGTTGEP